MDAHELKQLRTRISKQRAESEVLKDEVRDAQRKASESRRKLSGLEDQLREAQNTELIVTEHAILRYLERVVGLNLDEVKNKILTDTIRAQTKALGRSGRFPNDGFKVIMENGAVTTVITRE